MLLRSNAYGLIVLRAFRCSLNIRLPVPSNQFVVSTHPTGTRPHTNLDGSVTLIPTHSEFTAAGVNAGAAATAGPPQTPIMNRTLSPAAVMPMSLPPTPQHTADANSTQPLPQWQTHPPPQSHSTPQKSQTHTSFLSTVNSSAATAAAGGAGGGDTTGPRYVRQNLLTQTATSQATGTQFTFTAANDMKSAAEAAQFCSRCGTGRKDVHAQYCQKCGAPL